MGKTYNQFLSKKIDLSPLGVERRADSRPCFCTPRGARILGWAGVDGIHYCFIRGFGETVFSVNPTEIAPDNIHPLAKNFRDFLRLLLACGDANLLEQAWQWSDAQFEAAVAASPANPAASEAMEKIRESLHLTPMEHPWESMKALRDHFDSSQISYTEDFYDPEMNPNAPLPEWAVYYDGTIYGHTGRGKPGREIPVNREFRFGARSWLVPSVYSCAKGLVVDFCMRVDPEESQRFVAEWNAALDGRDGDALNTRERRLCELRNPLHFAFEPVVRVNGNMLRRRNGSGICYLPDDPSASEVRPIMAHYHLDPTFAWTFSRICFPWKTSRRPVITSLELTMVQEPVQLPGGVFEVSGPGDRIDLNIPGHAMTLTVEALEPQVLDASMLPPESTEYPTCFTVMSYTVSPAPEPEALSILDLSESDQPRQKTAEEAGAGSCEASAIGIIGGADGPTAISVGVPQSDRTFSACSALHFEPAERIRWYAVLSVTEYGPETISLI